MEDLEEIEPRYDIAPTEEILAIYQIEPDYLKASYFYWGLIPFWAKDKKIGSQMVNAKAG
ncbi:SOS response-associated peptidase family protein [Legionella israelensis]|uniref:SOS response-associated peptidase family protein n=1 Tax=Legionella israelensis TaxID=454 RepID=UPI0031591C73